MADPESNDAIIAVTGLTKRFVVGDKDPGLMGTVRHLFARKTRTIDAVLEASFEVQRGEVVGFLGPNGAGKTTTLKMLTGLIHPSAGGVRVCGQVPFQRRKDFLRRITLVMGNKQQLIWDLPALDSLRINAAVYDIPDDVARRRTDQLAELLGLKEELKQPVRKLSLGQRMKTELLAALLHRPDVLFLDEPTLGLDVNAQATMRTFLKDYNEEFGATILLTSHYMGDITALCRRVLLINQGRLMFDGDLERLVEQHATHRDVTVEFRTPVAKEALAKYGDVQSVDGPIARLVVERDRLPKMIGGLLQDLDVVDLEVREPPVEDIIGAVFESHRPEADPKNDAVPSPQDADSSHRAPS